MGSNYCEKENAMYDIGGKVAFITGGASGIGFCNAQELLRNGLKVNSFWTFLQGEHLLFLQTLKLWPNLTSQILVKITVT